MSPTATPPELLAKIEALRRQRWPSPAIAATLRLGRSTVAPLRPQLRALAEPDLKALLVQH